MSTAIGSRLANNQTGTCMDTDTKPPAVFALCQSTICTYNTQQCCNNNNKTFL